MDLPLKTLPSPEPSQIIPPGPYYEFFEYAKACPFRHDASGFDLVNAWWLAEAAFLAYSHRHVQAEWLAKAGLETRPLGHKSTQCFVAHNDRFVFVSFRGTEIDSYQDVLADLRFALVDSGQGGKVHQGFKQALDEVWEDLKDHLDALRVNGGSQRTFWFTGHSLGAALATLAADRYGHVDGLYTFGSPRVGDRDFAKRFRPKGRTHRFVNNNDIVARVPPPGSYVHVGELRYIDHIGGVHEDVTTLDTLTDRLRGAFWYPVSLVWSWTPGFLVPSDDLADHAPIYYVVKIWNHYAKYGCPIDGPGAHTSHHVELSPTSH